MNKSAYTRPHSLPDFSLPPLSEVVLGVQFQSPIGYQQIHAGDVWKLFKNDYPLVQEHQALPPTFETFGLSTQSVSVPFNFNSGAVHDRFWFVKSDDHELIQFQQDRIVHNWRKLDNSEYPRFSYMIEKFENELNSFQSFINDLSSQQLNINQCEISFVNQIQVDSFTLVEASKWFKFFNSETIAAEDFSFTFRETIINTAGNPLGRLTVEIGSAFDTNGKKVLHLNLIVKGKPEETTIQSSLAFLAIGHDLIVNRFTELTTDFSHIKWKRSK